MNVVLAGGSPLVIVVEWNVYLQFSIDISPFIGSDWGPHTRFQPKSPLILDYVKMPSLRGIFNTCSKLLYVILLKNT